MIKKYGTGDGNVIPEEDDAVPAPFTSEDVAELEQELRAEEPLSDSN